MSSKGIISILGGGWLGFPLGASLISEGFIVKASTTTRSKIEVFEKAGIDPYLVQFSESVQIPDLSGLFDAKTLIIAIPPGRQNPDGFANYKKMIGVVCDLLPASNIERIIFISSSSVYADANSIVTEFSDILPDTESGKLMADTEILLKDLPLQVIILRLSGLVGPDRMPGKFFAGKNQIPNGLAPVNLIHRKDVIRLIQCLIEKKEASGIYNGCAPSHPSREDFYSAAARVEGLELPQFVHEKTNWKIISSDRLENELSFSFEISSLMDWLNAVRKNN